MCQEVVKGLYIHQLIYSSQQSYEIGTTTSSSILQMGKLKCRKAEQVTSGHITTSRSHGRPITGSLESHTLPRAAITMYFSTSPIMPDGLHF